MEIKLLDKNIISIFHDNTTVVADFVNQDTPGGIQKSIDSVLSKTKIDIYLAFVTNTNLLISDKDGWIELFNRYQQKDIILGISECDIGKGNFIVSGTDCCNHIFFTVEVGHIRMGLFNQEPDNKYTLDNSPLDVLIGPGAVISKIYTDFEPFYIVVYDNWPGSSNLELNSAKAVKISKLTGWSRDGVLDLKAFKLKAD